MDLLRTAAPYLAYGFVSVVGLTSRIRWVDKERVERFPNFIYAFWHDRQVLFTYTHRQWGACVLVSRSRDGEVIAKTMELSGIAAIRGSSSRGAAAATRELLEAAKAGKILGITPDGPKGPAREVKPGVLFLARETGLPIVPISNAISRKLVLRRSWDRFQVPLPFARACVIHGAPVYVGREDDLEAKARELKNELDRITAEADRAIEA